MAEHLLTTTDNPYNPFTEWDEWLAYDTQVGHHTLALLARITVTSDDLSELDQSQAIDTAMEEIVDENASGMHILIDDTTVLINS